MTKTSPTRDPSGALRSRGVASLTVRLAGLGVAIDALPTASWFRWRPPQSRRAVLALGCSFLPGVLGRDERFALPWSRSQGGADSFPLSPGANPWFPSPKSNPTRKLKSNS